MFSARMAKGGGTVEIRSKAEDGSGAEKVVLAKQDNYHHPAWTPDGKYLTYLWGDGERNVSLWMVPIDGSAKPVAVVQPPSSQSNLNSYRVSPDGHWVAYVSDESGQVELYLTTFPEGKGKWRVSTNGAAYPSWTGNGKELFYETQANDFFVCPIAIKGSEVVIGTPQRLFHTGSPGIGVAFDVFSDGKHLLVNRSEEEVQTPLKLVTNWLAELKK
jgi:hypothetical protein